MEIVTRSFTGSREKRKSTCSLLLCHFNIFWDNDPTSSIGKFCQILKGTNLRSLALTTFSLKFQPILLRTNFASQLPDFGYSDKLRIMNPTQKLSGSICTVPSHASLPVFHARLVCLLICVCSLSKTWGRQLLFQFFKKHGSQQCVPISLFLDIIKLKQKTVFIMYLNNLTFAIFLHFHYKSDNSHLDKSEMMKKHHE